MITIRNFFKFDFFKKKKDKPDAPTHRRFFIRDQKMVDKFLSAEHEFTKVPSLMNHRKLWKTLVNLLPSEEKVTLTTPLRYQFHNLEKPYIEVREGDYINSRFIEVDNHKIIEV